MKKVLFKSRLFSLEKEHMSKEGKSFDILRIREHNSVVMLAFIEKDKIIMERQYRPAIRKYVYELPAGHIEKGESNLEAARREMREETGYTPKKLKFMLSLLPSPGLTTEMLYIYLAGGLIPSKRHLDKDEIINLVSIPLPKALQMIKKNYIKDSKTITAILYYVQFVKPKSNKGA
ncbi:MAG: NUDIX hydrolase [Candidatus Micrarchaeia archaeon]